MDKKRENLFLIISSLFSLIIIAMVIYSIVFLFKNIKIATDKGAPGDQIITRFNIEGLKKIGIGK